jgi:hypothetical protein
MDADLVIWLAVLVFVIAGWIYMAGEWGFVESFDERAFTLRTLLGTKRIITWNSLETSVQEFAPFLPRFVFRCQDRGAFAIRTSFAVLIRRRSIDDEFVISVRKRFQLSQSGWFQ